MDCNAGEAQLAHCFEEWGGPVGPIHPPAFAFSVVKESWVELDAVDAEIACLPRDFFDCRAGNRCADSPIHPHPIREAIAKRSAFFGQRDVPQAEAQVWERVKDGEIDRAFDKFGARNGVETQIAEELVGLQDIVGVRSVIRQLV